MLLTIMATNNIHMNMKPITLILRSKNSNTILSVSKIDGFFKIERICENTHSVTYVTSIEDLLKFIDAHLEVEDLLYNYREELAYIIDFDNHLLLEKNNLKNIVRIFVELIGKLFRKDDNKRIKREKKQQRRRRYKEKQRLRKLEEGKKNIQKNEHTIASSSSILDEQGEKGQIHEQTIEDEKSKIERIREYDKNMECYKFLIGKEDNLLIDLIDEYKLVNFFSNIKKEVDRNQEYSIDVDESNRQKEAELALTFLLEKKRNRERENTYTQESDNESESETEKDRRLKKHNGYMNSYKSIITNNRLSYYDILHEENVLRYFLERNRKQTPSTDYDDIRQEKEEEIAITHLLERIERRDNSKNKLNTIEKYDSQEEEEEEQYQRYIDKRDELYDNMLYMDYV